MAARVLLDTWRASGAVGCARKLRAAVEMAVPVLVRRRRTARSVAAYFDLITDDARLFYGDSFHFGYFPNGEKTLDEGLDAHTDLVAGLARVGSANTVLDVGCGLAAPALRIVRQHGCHVTGVNISREQVRQGNELVSERGLSERVTVAHGDARSLPFADESFDAVICLEAAGDICVAEEDKPRLVAELFRVLKPGGYVGFSDLAMRSGVSKADDRELRAVLYHSAEELVTDWPAIFAAQGFRIAESTDIIGETLATWDHVRAEYQRRGDEVARRYGRRLANRTIGHLERIRDMLATHGSYPAIGAYKPLPA